MLVLNTMLEYSSTPWLCYAAGMIAVCGALRLAIFNNDTEQASTFRGLPIPANAIFWIGVYGWIKSKTAAAAMAITAHVDASAMPKRSPRWKVINMATQPDKRLRQVRKLGISETILFVFVILYGLAGLAWTIFLYFLLSLALRKRI